MVLNILNVYHDIDMNIVYEFICQMIDDRIFSTLIKWASIQILCGATRTYTHSIFGVGVFFQQQKKCSITNFTSVNYYGIC